MNPLDWLAFSRYMPHGHCYFWRPSILTLHVLGNVATALAYFAMPAALAYIRSKRRRDLPPRVERVLWLCTAFIGLCGMTHVLAIVTIWRPYYNLEGVLLLLTGAVSLLTAVVIVKEIPAALHLRTSGELESINRELDQFAYVISHDLQEPIRAVKHSLEIVQEEIGEELNGDAREFFDEAMSGADRLGSMVEGLLSYSRIRKGTKEAFEPVDLKELCTEVVQSVRVALVEARGDISCESYPAVQGNRVLLRQLFQNLILNALKFRHEDRDPLITVSAESDGGFVRLCVRDNGIGFAPKYADRIFGMFDRLDTRRNGMGIGLAICREIVRHHGGEIWADGVEGEGARFFFTLPKG